MISHVTSIVRNKKPTFLKGLLVGALVAISGISLALTPLGLKLEEETGLGWLFSVRGKITPPKGVYIIGMDGASADFLEQPVRPRDWSRLLHADLIERLVQRGVSTIVFDIFFENEHKAEDNETFATAIELSGRAVLVQKVVRDKTSDVTIDRLVSPPGQLALAPIGLAPFPLPKIPNRISQFWTFYQARGDVPTLPVVALQVHALNTVGYDNFRALIEQTGIVAPDKLPSSIRNASDTWKLMALLRHGFEQDPRSLHRFLATLDNYQGSTLSSLADRALRALGYAYSSSSSQFLNFYGPSQTITTLPYRSLWDSEIAVDALPELSNSIVVVGRVSESPSDQLDGFFTVFSTESGLDLSGVEIAATALGNLLDQSSVVALSMVVIMGILLVFGMLAGIMASLIPGLKGLLAICIMATTYFALAQVSFGTQHLWWPVFIPLAIQLPLAALAGISLHYLGARKITRVVTRAMGQYVPQRVAERIAEQGSELGTAPEVVYATCLCSDVANYTTLSEQVSPDDLSRLSNEYFGLVGDRIKSHYGEILDFVGDGMTCVWTAAEPQREIRLQACLAALEILKDVQRFNKRHPSRPFPTRIGLNAGHVAVGNVGGGGHFSYSVTGDIVNSASRIEGLNKELHTQLLAAETVVSELDKFVLRRVGTFVLKGKSEKLTVFEIIDQLEHASTRTHDLCRRFNAALELFQNRCWADAGRSFEKLLEIFPEDGPTRFYLNICKRYSNDLKPLVQDTVIRLDTK